MASAKALSPASSLGIKTAFDFTKTKVEPKKKIEISAKTKPKSIRPDPKAVKNQIRLKSLSTGELMSSTSVIKMTKIADVAPNPVKLFTFSDMLPNKDPEPVTPTGSCGFMAVESEEAPADENEQPFSVMHNRRDKRKMSNTDITPTHNMDKLAETETRSNGEAVSGGFPVYVRCADPKVNITTLNPISVKEEIMEQFHISGLIQKAGQSLRVFCSTESQRNQFLQTGIIILNYRVVCRLPYS